MLSGVMWYLLFFIYLFYFILFIYFGGDLSVFVISNFHW